MDTSSEVQSLIQETEVHLIDDDFNFNIEMIDCIDHFNDETRLFDFVDIFAMRGFDDPLPKEEREDLMEQMFCIKS